MLDSDAQRLAHPDWVANSFRFTRSISTPKSFAETGLVNRAMLIEHASRH
jgi:hypothetical protein